MAKVLDKTMMPDSVKLNVIAIIAEDEATVNHRVDSILDAVKKGSAFAQLAAQYSADKSSSARGGELGWFREAQLMQSDADVARDAFAASTNEPFVISNDANPTQANIFMVSEKTTPVVKVKLAVIEKKVTASDATSDSVWQQATKFAADSHTADEMKANAQTNGFAFTPLKNLDYNIRRLGNLPSTRSAVRWAIDKKTKINSVSDVLDCGKNLIVATVTARNTSGYTSFEAVKSTLLSELRKSRKFELMQKDFVGKNINDLKSDGLSIDSVKDLTFATTMAGSLGNEPKLIAIATLAETHKVSAPIEGNMGVIVFEVLQTKQSDIPYNEQQEKMALEGMHSPQNVFYMALDALKKCANVKDERYKLF
jgi:peptidyl-prolyl cis-trans isomerase D